MITEYDAEVPINPKNQAKENIMIDGELFKDVR